MFSRRSWRDSETLAIDAVDALPPRRGMTPDARRDEAISRGLAKRLEQLAAERERRERAAEKADAEFSNEFLNAARKCFEMIDDDQSGTLEKAEMSARCVRPSTCARRGDGVRSAAAHTPSTRLVTHHPIPPQRHSRPRGQGSDRLPHELRQ